MIMKLKSFIYILIPAALFMSCKDQLDVQNPNQPTPESAATESGIISLSQGGVYINGFKDLKYQDGVYGQFWSGAMGFHEIMGDVVGAEAANAFLNQIGCPNSVTLDNGTVVLNPNSPKEQISMLREINRNSNQGSNTIYYEWGYMYNLIAACNKILEVVEEVDFTQDGPSKKATIQAWAYFWKGFAYSRIGSTYYAGIINDEAFATNNKYVTKENIIAESNKNYDKAATTLSGIPNSGAYTQTISKIIPSFFQVGKGGPPTVDMWKRNINTLKARNILVNKTVKTMTASDWQSILTLVNDGTKPTDKVFTGRSNVNGDFMAAASTVAGKTQSSLAGGNTYKLSERWVQEFKAGDKRLANNVKQTKTWTGNSDRGNAFNTRYTLVSGGLGLSGVVIFADIAPGAYELYLTSTSEENELMKAEALINTGQIEQGLAIIDAVRAISGAGLTAVAGTGLTLAQAKEELRSERRIMLAFRGLSFYDARRWGVIDPLAQGGGRTGAVVLTTTGVVNTNAKVDYNFLDYWDVPDNELAYNPAGDGSAPVKNPK
jgi:hypothetical protein